MIMGVFFKNFGMDIFAQEQYFAFLTKCVCEEGKIFPGYACTYFYKNWGRAETIVTVAPDAESGQNEVLGFNTHIMGNCFWKLRVSTMGIGSKKYDPYSYSVIFNDMDGHGLIPINIIHADVIPSFLEDDVVRMQVCAFPLLIHYFQDDSKCDDSNMETVMGKKLVLSEGVFPVGLFGEDEANKDVSILKGKVAAVEEYKVPVEGSQENFFCVTVDTPYGPIDIAHTADFVIPEERSLIRKGSIVETYCVISGDVALDDYQLGAVYDEENELRLLRSCIEHGDFERMTGALSENAIYKDAVGPAQIIHTLKGINAQIDREVREKGLKYYSYMGTLAKIENDPDGVQKYPIGKRCVVLATPEPDNYNGFLLINRGIEGKIKEIETCTNKNYRFRLDKIPVSKMPYDDFDFKPVQLEREESEWLDLISECFNNLSFDSSEFYFGMEPEAEIYLVDYDGKSEFILKDKEQVFKYMANKVEMMRRKDVKPRSEIVKAPGMDEKHGVMVSDGEEKFLLTIDISERRRLIRMTIAYR